MTIDLKPEQQRVIDLAVQSGAYQDPGEVLDQAFEIIREQLDIEDWMIGQREEVAAHIATGFAQAERGELIGFEENVPTEKELKARRDFLRKAERMRSAKPPGSGSFSSAEEMLREDRRR